jgi:hypothetical protein
MQLHLLFTYQKEKRFGFWDSEYGVPYCKYSWAKLYCLCVVQAYLNGPGREHSVSVTVRRNMAIYNMLILK